MSHYTGLFRKFIQGQIALSNGFDRTFFPREYRLDGSADYLLSLVPEYIHKHSKIYDVGGGKQPCISQNLKKKLGLYVTGLDIDRNELKQAPAGIYDEVLEADITTYSGKGDGDIILCHTLLEHVKSVDAAFRGLESILKPGGKIVVFVPSRNALYARLNLVLPESLKKRLLYFLFPQAIRHQGFKSYYDCCTPRDFKRIAVKYGLKLEEERVYFISGYFSFFFPVYLCWRLWSVLFRMVAGEQAAESFSMVFQKQK